MRRCRRAWAHSLRGSWSDAERRSILSIAGFATAPSQQCHVQGRLQCLGSTSHLKLRFGGGYLLEVHAPDDEALQARLAAFIARELGGQEDEERHLGYSKYRLPAERQVISLVCCFLACETHHMPVFTTEFHGCPDVNRCATPTIGFLCVGTAVVAQT